MRKRALLKHVCIEDVIYKEKEMHTNEPRANDARVSSGNSALNLSHLADLLLQSHSAEKVFHSSLDPVVRVSIYAALLLQVLSYYHVVFHHFQALSTRI